jgi:hypothetical protein
MSIPHLSDLQTQENYSRHEDLKGDKQIDQSVSESIASAVYVEDSPHFPDLQIKVDCRRYLQEGDELKSSDQHSFLYDSLTKVEHSVFNIETNDGEEERRGSYQQLSLHFLSTEEEQFTFSIETSESNQQLQYSQLDQQLKEVFLHDIYDPIDNYLKSMSNKCIKSFLPEEECLCNDPN